MDLVSVRPGHIHFEVQTLSESMETCDFRFYSVEKVVTEAERRRLEDGDAGEPGENEGEAGQENEGQEENNEEVNEEGTVEKSPEKAKTEVSASPSGPNASYTKKEFSDVAFFRLGYFDYLKLNT